MHLVISFVIKMYNIVKYTYVCEKYMKTVYKCLVLDKKWGPTIMWSCNISLYYSNIILLLQCIWTK